jgi:hypothetical protein
LRQQIHGCGYPEILQASHRVYTAIHNSSAAIIPPGRESQRESHSGYLFAYFDFFSNLAFLFSMMDFAGFFLTSFLMSLDFAIANLLYE